MIFGFLTTIVVFLVHSTFGFLVFLLRMGFSSSDMVFTFIDGVMVVMSLKFFPDQNVSWVDHFPF